MTLLRKNMHAQARSSTPTKQQTYNTDNLQPSPQKGSGSLPRTPQKSNTGSLQTTPQKDDVFYNSNNNVLYQRSSPHTPTRIMSDYEIPKLDEDTQVAPLRFKMINNESN